MFILLTSDLEVKGHERVDPVAYKKMVKSYQDADKATGWFDSIYTDAEGDHRAVFWADLEPGPYLLEWLEKRIVTHPGRKAIVIGCGLVMMQRL
jgi:hypothetical protein